MNQTLTLREAIVDCAQSNIQTLDEGYQWKLNFPKDFMGFKGHFPGHPVLPAFIQILTTQCAISQRTQQAWALQRIKRAKFMQIIQPEQDVCISWKEKDMDAGVQGNFTLTVDDKKVASFIAIFKPEENGDA